MVIESSEHWITHRKQLIVEIGDSIQRIQGNFGSITIRLNGKINSVNFQQSQSVKDLLSGIEGDFMEAAGKATDEAEKVIDAAIAAASGAAQSTDKSVFKIKTRFGQGSPDVAAILKNKRYSSGFRLSDKLWPQDKKQLRQFYTVVEKGLAGGAELGSVVRQMAALKIQHAPEKLPKYLAQLESAAKQAAQGMPGARKQFDRIANSVKKQLAKRKVAEYLRPTQQSLGALGTRQSTNAFLARLEKAVNKGSAALIQEATDKHLVKLAEYHSSRAIRTMAGRAFMDQGKADRKTRPWVIGEKWTLSLSHPRFDECDIRASVDFGVGPGVYRVGSAPYDHVSGLCYLTDVIDDQFLENDKPAKLPFKKGYKEMLKQVTPGSDLCKFANKLGSAQNAGKVAEEMATAGPNFAKWAVKSNVKKYSIDEVNALMKAAIADAEKAAQKIAKGKTAEAGKKWAATYQADKAKKAAQKEQSQAIDASLESRKNIPFSAMKRARQQLAEETQAALISESQKLHTMEKKADAALKEYHRQKQAERLFTGKMNAYQQERAALSLKTHEDLMAEAKAQADAVEKLKAAQEALKPNVSKHLKEPAWMNFKEARQVGQQAGSNPGGLYEVNGEKWYIKFPKSELHAKNEALAAEFYRMAGINAPEIRLVADGDRVGIASRIIDGLGKNPEALKSRKLFSLHEGFGMDAWLANWDVVGLNWDNLLVKGKSAYRIDTGGAMLFRAQGTPKGAAFGAIVEEWDSFRTVQSFTTTPVFKNITDKKLIASGKRVLKISDGQIREMVKLYGLPDDLAETLIERKRFIRDKVKALEQTAKPRTVAAAKIPDKGLTAEELTKIVEARGNGYAVEIDKRDIEDQQILFWREKKPDGTWIMNGTFKVRGAAFDSMESLIRQSVATGPIEERDAFWDLMEKNIKSIRYRIAQGKLDVNDWGTTIFGRFDDIKARFDLLEPAKKTHYQSWVDAMDHILSNRSVPAQWTGPQVFMTPFIRQPVVSGQLPRINFAKKTAVYDRKAIDRGRITHTGDPIFPSGFGSYYEATLPDGSRVRYWGDDAHFAERGKIQITSLKDGDVGARSIFDTLDELKIDSSRATAQDAEEIYLTQIAYTTQPRRFFEFQRFDIVAEQDRRVAMMRDWVSQSLNVPDVAALPDYNPGGRHEFWGDGRIIRERPDLVGAKWENFEKKYSLFHSIEYSRNDPVVAFEAILNSGGKFITSTEKLRRGVPFRGQSPEADMGTGGASYFFTRIRKKALTERGVYWKTGHLKRLDVISYDHDFFGRTTGSTVIDNRKSTIDELIHCAARIGNETIFKDGLSVFDGLEKIVVMPDQVQPIIDIFKRHGYTVFPDGRRIEEIVITE